MTVKEWLLRGRKLGIRIKFLKESKQAAYEKATSAVSRPVREYKTGSRSGSGDRKMEKYAELSIEVDKEIAELEDIRKEILTAIHKLSDNILCSLLTGYYVNDLTWEEVADKLGYTLRHTTRLHNRALALMQPIIEQYLSETENEEPEIKYA